MTDAAGSEAWSYDNMGRPLADQRTTNSITKTAVYSYSLDGSVATISYPVGGRTITYQPGGAGRPLSAIDQNNSINYATNAHYAPPGELAAMQNGASVNLTDIYNNRLQPCWMYATTGTALAWGSTTQCASTASTGNVLDLKYNFNWSASDNGNVVGITNNRDTTRSQSFTYDQLSRLATAKTSSTTGMNCWGETFSYDIWANLLSIGAASGYTGCTQENLSVTATTSNQISGDTYDASGNLTIIPGTGGASYAYNGENQITSTAGMTYTYEGDGRRVKKSNGTLYWYGMGSDALDETDLSGNLTNEYVFFGGQRVARRDASNNVFYYFEDHLGTSRIITNAAGTVCYNADFYPFGGERSPIVNTCPQNYKFTGKERDSESGLDNFAARYNSYSVGRFMSPDPLGGHQEDPQTLNRYSYVRNNPLNLTDPTGLDFYLTCKWAISGKTQTSTGQCTQVNIAGKQVLVQADKNGKATVIRNDKNGNLVDQNGNKYSGTVDASGVHFTQNGSDTSSTGTWVNGSAETKFTQTTGALAGFEFDFNQTSKQQTANGSFFYTGAPRDAYDAILKAGFSASMADDFFNPLHGYIGSYHYRSPGDPGTGENSGHLIIRGVGPWHPWDTVSTRGDLHFGETNPQVNFFQHFRKDVF